MNWTLMNNKILKIKDRQKYNCTVLALSASIYILLFCVQFVLGAVCVNV